MADVVRSLIKSTILFIICLITQLPAVKALSVDQKNIYGQGIYYYDIGGAPSCTGSSTISLNEASNTDYAGRSILNQGELKALSDNSATYQKAADQAGIPWQVLAAVHYREHDFSTEEPDNGQGVYQIVNSDRHTAGAYPSAGTRLSPSQFLAQSLDAANFIKTDGASLDIQSDVSVIKDSLVKYNGEPNLYVEQAQALGFSANQGYEGSPYVMNVADARRDPTNGPISTWQQSFGSYSQPANANQYGAYIVYASVTGVGVSTSSCITSISCDSAGNSTQDLSPVRQNIVCIANQELAKWNSHQLKPGTDFYVYSQNSPEDWCADFVSWVYNQAKYPLSIDATWRIPAVDTIKSIGEKNQNFHWHPSSGYTPRPGDLAIHTSGSDNYHVNIVVGVSGNQVTLVGGNQSSNDFNQSVVSKDQSSFGGSISGYVSPD